MKNLIIIVSVLFLINSCVKDPGNNSQDLFNVETHLNSRSISFENLSGEPGEGGKAVRDNLGPGRKGAPNKVIEPNETVVLCDINNSGTIRHIWMTGSFVRSRGNERLNQPERDYLLRSTIIRAYWDGQEHPSIECPLGDFMGLAHGKITVYESAVHSIAEKRGLNFWLPMPFTKNARITLTNESDIEFTLYFQIDYTINNKHSSNIGRMHTCFRRENPTTMKEDFELLPKRTGKGRFMGAVMGIRNLHPGWWGEGEVKFYMDGDTELPTICGTGAEDYIGLSHNLTPNTFLYHGANLRFISDSSFRAPDVFTEKMLSMRREYVSMYRWHILDPIYWKKDIRVTIQQIGHTGSGLHERYDDWSTATFWYEPLPSEPLPEIVPVEKRTADLEELYKVQRVVRSYEGEIVD
jgi:hypothetical protein